MLLIHYSLSEHTALLNFQSTSHWFANQLVILILTLVYTALIIAAHFYEAHLQQQSLLLQAKRQERMHLSQDLHDTLGSSLVRSIGAISNQQHQLSSDQVLSMLKLFRDDLRQVIDHNTHTDETTIPENPTAWAAPIRHRFSQVFEALNINAAWHFDPVWHYTPTAIECVNLRRITEEALTNIIKHSQATQVEVQLILNAQHQLELRIRDNGCGFAVEYMTQQGINVGLKSMQQRVESIGAQLFINSNAQGTQIVIIKA